MSKIVSYTLGKVKAGSAVPQELRVVKGGHNYRGIYSDESCTQLVGVIVNKRSGYVDSTSKKVLLTADGRCTAGTKRGKSGDNAKATALNKGAVINLHNIEICKLDGTICKTIIAGDTIPADTSKLMWCYGYKIKDLSALSVVELPKGDKLAEIASTALTTSKKGK